MIAAQTRKTEDIMHRVLPAVMAALFLWFGSSAFAETGTPGKEVVICARTVAVEAGIMELAKTILKMENPSKETLAPVAEANGCYVGLLAELDGYRPFGRTGRSDSVNQIAEGDRYVEIAGKNLKRVGERFPIFHFILIIGERDQ